MILVSIITVNYNHSYLTEQMLASIEAFNTYANIEIIVVDNGSKENPIPQWTLTYPNIKFIRSEKNLGFAGGNNLGIAAAKGAYLFFVNNDTEFTPGLVEKLVATLDEHPRIGMVSPKIRYYEQKNLLQYVGFTPMNYFTCQNKCIGLQEEDKGQYDNTVAPTGFAHGAAMMVRQSAILLAGPMYENYFLYYEEMDWCERIRQSGYEIWVNTNALIYHKESVSVGKKSALKEYFMNRNRILFIRRNGYGRHVLFFYAYFIFLVTPRNILQYIKERNTPFIKQIFRAIAWNLTQRKDSPNLGFAS